MKNDKFWDLQRHIWKALGICCPSVKKLRRYDNYFYWFYAFEKNNFLMGVRTASGGLKKYQSR
jgi:hypothetical protein